MIIRPISTDDKDMANGMRDMSGTPLTDAEIEYVKSEIQRQAEKEISPMVSPQSIMLAKQARLEQMKNGYVTTICPKCHEHPRITTTPRGERTIISCPCGYVKNIEINF